MSNAAAQTAVGPMVIIAVEQSENPPLVRDELAYRMLPSLGRFAVACTRWRPARRALIAATEKKIPGLWASMVCRKRYIDEKLLDAADGTAVGIDAVVVLGAGFDTRAYRLPGLAGIPVFEVDLPANIEAKRARLVKIYGEIPAAVTLVPIDFEAQSIADTLAQHGYRGDQRTFFVWEAVTQYLSEDGVRKTFEFLAAAPPGSQLVFITYLRQDFLDGTVLYGGEAAYREFVQKRRLWHFGLLPEQVGGFLTPYGWTEVEQAGPREFTARYLQPAGRVMPVSEIERCVHAVKQ
ncbi:SAM-dependent methyltransferase [Amycolatopsis jejuensis]|uniref:SAM-dependent methyltransferase n=1 Tax=Amycolatopsis jejuensis TaxID=330084 RepID=UPI0005273AD8|nr:SAM-dependent methyltransferase [Amycolatopsis jejuensis]